CGWAVCDACLARSGAGPCDRRLRWRADRLAHRPPGAAHARPHPRHADARSRDHGSAIGQCQCDEADHRRGGWALRLPPLAAVGAVHLRSRRRDRLLVQPRRGGLYLFRLQDCGQFALRPRNPWHSRQSGAHAHARRPCDVAAGDALLHLGRARGNCRRAFGAGHDPGRARQSRLSPLRHRARHADPRRHRESLWRDHRRHDLRRPLRPRGGDRSLQLAVRDRLPAHLRGALRAAGDRRPHRRLVAPLRGMAEPGMSESALSIAGISKNFGGLRVARSISLSLETGARHALIGPNGAGKTTLVNIMSGLLQPSAGTIHLAGADITHVSPERRVALGLARTFQISSLFPTLTVAENVGLAFEARFGLDRKLWGSVRKSASVVDGAAALLHSLGLLDEPAAGLAAADRGALLDLLLKLPAALTILVIEHDMSLVFRLAQRITVLVEGAVMTEGTVAEIRADPRVRDVYLGTRAHG